MPKKVIAFSCIYGCKRNVTTKKQSMLLHEKGCYFNPINRACASCANLFTEMETYYNPDHGGCPGSTDYEIKVKYCSKEIDLKKSLKNNCEFWVSK